VAEAPLRILDADAIAAALTYPALVEALRAAFRADIAAPVRHHHTVPQPGRDATLLLMPAWTAHVPAKWPPVRRKGHAPIDESGSRADTGRDPDGAASERFLGCKIVTVFPDNAAAGQPSLHGRYLLMSGATGAPLALMDAQALTAWRTAAASALAASYLARADAEHLVMIGAGALAPHLVRAHLAVRPIRRVTLWNRTHGRAVSLAFGLTVTGIEATIADDLETAVREADIVCCATLATEPIVRGAWLKPGTHVDLVGGFTPKMREADNDAIKRARVFVDTRAGAGKEAGDIAIPLRRGILTKKGVRGDLFELCRGKAKGRTADKQITLFKSVGSAIEDLAAAMLVWRNLRA
jgi:ornithine cyclodeaminase/alanine dehydrogenase-like protein (mu-crystallin family)